MVVRVEKLVVRGERTVSRQSYDQTRPYEKEDMSILLETFLTDGTQDEMNRAFEMLEKRLETALDAWEQGRAAAWTPSGRPLRPVSYAHPHETTPPMQSPAKTPSSIGASAAVQQAQSLVPASARKPPVLPPPDKDATVEGHVPTPAENRQRAIDEDGYKSIIIRAVKEENLSPLKIAALRSLVQKQLGIETNGMVDLVSALQKLGEQDEAACKQFVERHLSYSGGK